MNPFLRIGTLLALSTLYGLAQSPVTLSTTLTPGELPGTVLQTNQTNSLLSGGALTPGSGTITANVLSGLANTKTRRIKPAMHFIGRNTLFNSLTIASGTTNVTFPGSTGRSLYTTVDALSVVQLVLNNSYYSAPAELPGYNTVIERASIEYPLGVLSQQLSVNGSTTWTLDPKAVAVVTDPIGVSIPAGAQFAVRLYVRVAIPPTAVAAVAATGTTLAPGSYYYKVTAIDNGVESGGSTEVNVTTTTGAQNVNLSWTPYNLPNTSSYRIYRGTASNGESYLGSTPGPQTSFLDTGALTTVSTITVPPTQQWVWNRMALTGESGNAQSFGGSGLDVTSSTGPITPGVIGGATGNGQRWIVGPAAVLGDSVSGKAITGIGDSILYGQGLNTNNCCAGGYIYQMAGTWLDAGLTTGLWSDMNLAGGSAQQSDFATQSQAVRLRSFLTQYSDYVVDAMGTNDLGNGATWTTLATNQVNYAATLSGRGIVYYLATITPRTSSTDNWMTLANQTPITWPAGYTAARDNYNTWVRGGSQMSAGAPVLTGGVPSPYIAGYVEMCTNLEVNSSGIPALNGNYWIAAASNPPLYSGTLTGTPTTTSLAVAGTPFTTNAYVQFAIVQMTSGAANGQVAIVWTNTTNTITLFANNAKPTGSTAVAGLTVAPSAGDTFSIYASYAPDGLHPGAASLALMGSALAGLVATLPAY